MTAPSVLHRRRPDRPRRSWGKTLATTLLFGGALGVVGGWGIGSPTILSMSTGLLALSYLLSDLTREGRVSVTVMTFFAFAAAVRAFANARGLTAANAVDRGEYFVYAVDEHVMLAAQLTLAGALLPMLGFWLTGRSPTALALNSLLPEIRGTFSLSTLIRGGILAVTLVFASHGLVALPSLGTVTALFYMIPTFIVFVFARVGASRRSTITIALAVAIAMLEATRAMLFDYLRAGVLVPLFALVSGIIVGQRSLQFLLSKWAIPLYASLVIYVAAFDQLGEARRQGGVERVRVLMEEAGTPLETPAGARSFLSRLTTFNQLSRIGWIVEQDGFLRGATLDYLAYAFIPRFLWPEKPLIAKGSWFAVRIGQAYILPDGRANNAVNMTIAGELYLNYDWPGVIVGGVLVGWLLALFWSRTGSMRDDNNVLGWSFAFYLLWLGLSLEQDLQFVVTLTAIYLVFLALSIAARQVGVDSHGRAPTRSGSVLAPKDYPAPLPRR